MDSTSLGCPEIRPSYDFRRLYSRILSPMTMSVGRTFFQLYMNIYPFQLSRLDAESILKTNWNFRNLINFYSNFYEINVFFVFLFTTNTCRPFYFSINTLKTIFC